MAKELIYLKPARKKHHGQKPHHQTNAAQSQVNSVGGRYTEDQMNGNFNFDTIHGLQLKEVEYRIPDAAERKRMRNAFAKKRVEFLQYLATEKRDLLIERLGLSDEEINLMKEGRSVNGYNVHHMHPLALGGKNEFSNFILTPLAPHDQWHHDVMDPQVNPSGRSYDEIEGKHGTFKIPYSDEMIYDPKKYGFTRDGKTVEPNYTSHEDLESKPQNYTVEQVAQRNARNGRTTAKTIAPKLMKIAASRSR